MAQLKHRVFNQDRFLDKFTSDPSSLGSFLALWEGQLPDLPEPLAIDSFKEYLSNPPADCAEFEEMVEGLFRCYDLCTPHGEELMHDSIEVNCSEVAETEGYKDWVSLRSNSCGLALRTPHLRFASSNPLLGFSSPRTIPTQKKLPK